MLRQFKSTVNQIFLGQRSAMTTDLSDVALNRPRMTPLVYMSAQVYLRPCGTRIAPILGVLLESSLPKYLLDNFLI